MVRRHTVAPAVIAALRLQGIKIPDSLAAEVQATSARALHLTKELHRLHRRLNEAGIPFLTVKGPALAQWLHGSVTSRHYTDLDIFTRPEDARAAISILEADGFSPIAGPPPGYEDRWMSRAWEARHIHPDQRVVEIHWALFPPGRGDEGLTEAAWSHATTLPVADREVPVPAPEDHAAFIILHGHRHGWQRLQWLIDADACIQRLGLAAFRRQAQAEGFRRRLDSTLLACDTLLGTSYQIQADRPTRRLTRIALKALFKDAL